MHERRLCQIGEFGPELAKKGCLLRFKQLDLGIRILAISVPSQSTNVSPRRISNRDNDRHGRNECSNTHWFEIKHLANDRLGPCSGASMPGHRDITRGRQVNDTLSCSRSTAIIETAQGEGFGALGNRDSGEHVGHGPCHSLVRRGFGGHAVEGDHPWNAWLDRVEAGVILAVVDANRVYTALFGDDCNVIELSLV